MAKSTDSFTAPEMIDFVQQRLDKLPDGVPIANVMLDMLVQQSQQLTATEARLKEQRETMERMVDAAFKASVQGVDNTILSQNDFPLYNIYSFSEGFVLRTAKEVEELINKGVIDASLLEGKRR